MVAASRAAVHVYERSKDFQRLCIAAQTDVRLRQAARRIEREWVFVAQNPARNVENPGAQLPRLGQPALSLEHVRQCGLRGDGVSGGFAQYPALRFQRGAIELLGSRIIAQLIGNQSEPGKGKQCFLGFGADRPALQRQDADQDRFRLRELALLHVDLRLHIIVAVQSLSHRLPRLGEEERGRAFNLEPGLRIRGEAEIGLGHVSGKPAAKTDSLDPCTLALFSTHSLVYCDN